MIENNKILTAHQRGGIVRGPNRRNMDEPYEYRSIAAAPPTYLVTVLSSNRAAKGSNATQRNAPPVDYCSRQKLRGQWARRAAPRVRARDNEAYYRRKNRLYLAWKTTKPA